MNERSYERLFRLVKLGDEEAAYALIVEAERRGDIDACEQAVAAMDTLHTHRFGKARRRLAELRDILHRRPSRQNWRSLSRLLQNWPLSEGFLVALMLAERRLNTWPPHLRCATAAWWHHLIQGRGRPELWRLARRLELDGVRLTAQGAERLMSRSELACINALSLGSCRLGDGGMAALARTHGLFRLLELELSNNQISLLGLRQLSHSPYMINLRLLDLSCNPRLGDEGMRVLAGSRLGEKLETLRINSCDVGEMGVGWLLAEDEREPLRALSLACNKVGDTGARRIANASAARGLEHLDLSGNGIGHAGVKALASSSHMTSLKVLDLKDNPLGEEAIRALAQACAFTSLETLELTVAGRERAAAKRLLGNPRLPALTQLNLGAEVQVSQTQTFKERSLSSSAMADALAERFGRNIKA